MAKIKNSAFEIKVTNHEFDSMANITGRFVNDRSEAEDCAAGFLTVRKELSDCDGYDGVKNTNSWVMKKAEATTKAATPIYACNTFDVNIVTDEQGNEYKVGCNTLGLALPAGHDGTFTRIYFDGDKSYRFGVGNMTAGLEENTILTIQDGKLLPAMSAPAAGLPYFEVIKTGDFTVGAHAGFGYVDVIAHTSVGA